MDSLKEPGDMGGNTPTKKKATTQENKVTNTKGKKIIKKKLGSAAGVKKKAAPKGNGVKKVIKKVPVQKKKIAAKSRNIQETSVAGDQKFPKKLATKPVPKKAAVGGKKVKKIVKKVPASGTSDVNKAAPSDGTDILCPEQENQYDATSDNMAKEQKPNSTMLKHSTNASTTKKENRNFSEAGKTRITSNFGALMAGFFSRQLEEKALIKTPGLDRESKSGENLSKDEMGDGDGKAASASPVDQPQKMPGPGRNQSHQTEAKVLKKGDIQNGEQRRVLSGVGALLAGLGSRQHRGSNDSSLLSMTDKDVSSEESPTAISATTREEARKPEEKVIDLVKEKEVSSKKESSNSDSGNHDENDYRKVTSGVGALLSGLGSRHCAREESSKNSAPPQGYKEMTSKNSPQVVELQDKLGNTSSRNKQKFNNNNASSADSSNTANAGDIVEIKKTNSIGSMLAGLASRREQFANNNQQQENYSSGSRGRDYRNPIDAGRGYGDFGFVRDKFQRNPKEKLRDKSHDERMKYESSSHRRDEPEFKGNRSQRRGEPDFRENHSQRRDEPNFRENHSQRRDEPNFRENRSQRNIVPVVKEENNVVYVRGHVPKVKPSDQDMENYKKSLEKNMSFEEEAEVRKTHSLGSLLSNLATRTFPDPPPPPPPRSDERDRGCNDYSDDSYNRRGRGSRKRGYEDFDDEEDDDRSSDKYSRGRDKKGFRERRDREPFDPKKAAEDVKKETERLEKMYGAGVFSVGFTENRIMAYVCEICCAQLTKQTIEAHADGMQHLKKKNLWEKKKRYQAQDEGKPKYLGGRSGWVKVDDANKSESSPNSSSAPTPVPDGSSGDGGYGYDGGYGEDGYGYSNQYYMQPPSFGPPGFVEMGSMGGYMMGAPPGGKGSMSWSNNQYGMGPAGTPAQPAASQINTAIPPPPPPAAEPPPKPKPAKGGATVSLLQRLDACAVKNEKDLELASGVISSLLKSLKEFNHKRGDTKFIEVLTEIDIKFRSLKPKSLAASLASKDISTASSDSYKTSAGKSSYSTYGSSDSSKYDNASKNVSSQNTGTWYSQGRGNPSAGSYSNAAGGRPTSAALDAVASNYSSKTSGGYASGGTNISTAASSGYSSQGISKTSEVSSSRYGPQATKSLGYAGHGASGAPAYSAQPSYNSTGYQIQTTGGGKSTDIKDYHLQEKSTSKDTGYYTQGPTASQDMYQGYPPKAGSDSVLEIIRSGNEPPPPPPPESNSVHNYAAQGYNLGFFNPSAPPPSYNHQHY